MASQLKAGLSAPRTQSSVPTLMSRIGGALTFSHLAGLGRGTARMPKASSEEERDEEDEGKPKEKKGKKAEDGGDEADAEGGDPDDEHEDQDRSNGDSKKGKKGKAEKGDDDKDYEDEGDGDDGNPKDKKGKKADDSGESEDEEMEDEDDDEKEMHGKSPLAAARRRERERCAAIFNDRAAARNPQLAAQLAFNTSLTRGEAIKVLQGSAPPAAGGNSQRADRNPRLGPGAEAPANSQQAISASWDHAMKQVRPDLKQ